MPRILLADPLDADAERRLEAAAEVVRPGATDARALREAVSNCVALITRTHTHVSRDLLLSSKQLRVVGVAGVGTDRVDLGAARELGIAVLNTPDAAGDAVAEFTLALMLQLLRPVPRLAEDLKRGMYRETRAVPHGLELRELTVGIVGMGRIGARVGRICSAGFGAKVLFNDIVDVGSFDFAAEAVDKSTIWSSADIISLHVPLTERTRALVNAEVLGRFQSHALLINTARGALIDTGALTAALLKNRIGGAALDVTHPEPLPPGHAMFSIENCILTPHVAARTFRGLGRMFAIVEAVLAHLGRPAAELD